jgi:hypothetical protein
VPDTLALEPGNPQGLNRYAYVTNNPLRYTDRAGTAYAPMRVATRLFIPSPGRSCVVSPGARMSTTSTSSFRASR